MLQGLACSFAERFAEYPGGDYTEALLIGGIPYIGPALPNLHGSGTYGQEHPSQVQYEFPSSLLRGYSRLHILHSLGHAADVRNGTCASTLFAEYAAETEERLTLVIEVDTAEGAYDRLDVQPCLLHDKVPPYHLLQRLEEFGRVFLGHLFDSCAELDASKLVTGLRFELSEEVCRPRPRCGRHEPTTWFSVSFEAVTLEY